MPILKLLKQAVKAAGYDAAVMEGLEDPSEQEEQELQRYRQADEKSGCSGNLWCCR